MRSQKLRGFTLIELLTVITIIFILAGLVLAVSRYVTNKGKYSRAQSEIAAMSAACESYKADNGVYPDDGSYNTSGTYVKGNTATLNAQTDGVPQRNKSIRGDIFLGVHRFISRSFRRYELRWVR